MKTEFNNFQEASDSNWNLLKSLFATSKLFKLVKPTTINSVFDGLLSCRKDDKEILILVEVKIRKFDTDTLQSKFNDKLFLEKKKFEYLHKAAKKYQNGNREIKIWYLNAFSDDVCMIFDITDQDFKWETRTMNDVTYNSEYEEQRKIVKKITYLDTNTAFYKCKLSNSENL